MPWDLDDASKTRMEIELTRMRLLRVQQQLRNDIAHEIRCAVALQATQEDSCSRKQRKKVQTIDGNSYNRDQEKKKQKQHAKYLDAIISHCKAFKEYHTSMGQKLRRINRSLITYHTSRARKELQMKEKEEKERMRALRVGIV